MTGNEIAIIGMAIRFPGAATPAAFWANLRQGAEAIRFFTAAELEQEGIDPALLQNPAYVPARGFLEGADLFDAAFFGLTPREAELMDPQHRLFLESAWETVESAGYDARSYPGRIGVYAGSGANTYLLFSLCPTPEELMSGAFSLGTGMDKDFLPTRVSYELNLRGPSVAVQTACSTSLVAVHLACQSLLNGECDMALAGGATVGVPLQGGYLWRDGSISSPDGHCRAFDEAAAGTVAGSGVGVVLLKHLDGALRDRDPIYAVILGSAINNDGAGKIGFTTPGVEGQAAVIAEAQAVAGVEPETVTYVEAHGTGTPLGDPIEVEALTQAFRSRTSRTGFCAIGSVKSNVGHLDTAAGVAGLIKAALALQHREIPPSLHLHRPNPKIDFDGSPFYAATRLQPWQSSGVPLRAGVSSFGIGGTNAHVVMEEAPPPAASGPSRPHQLLLLSARTPEALEAASANLAVALREQSGLPLADVAYTLAVGRRPFPCRRAIICQDHDGAVAALQDPLLALTARQEHEERPVAFLFPGQGAQYPRMAMGLYQQEPVFAAHVDRLAALLEPHLGRDIRQVLAEATAAELEHTALAQPALFVVEYALARMLMEWGIRPGAMAGHSLGEYVAACLAGVFTEADALRLVAARGRLMQAMIRGSMLSVPLPEAAVQPLLTDGLSLAAVNAPAQTVVSGPTGAVEALGRRLAEQGVECRRLHTSHAFHSALMEPAAAELARVVQSLRLAPPAIPFLSNLTGTWITAEQAIDPAYWARHLRQTVRFGDNLAALVAQAGQVLVEVGPGHTLSTLARRVEGAAAVVPLLGRAGDFQGDGEHLLGALARLWLAGARIDWPAYYGGEERNRVILPTYPFERRRYWVDRRRGSLTTGTVAELSSAPPAHGRPGLLTPYVAPRTELEQVVAEIWAHLLGIGGIGVHDDFFDLGGHSVLVSQLVARMRDRFGVDLPLRTLFDATTVAAQSVLVEELLIARIKAMEGEERHD